uniref:GmrSD restriction endonucleases N-terminal domain-containing protein n=1 Tax=Candidatus Kentrum sp. SD TaxID=2126332 RepID=A0A451BI42_9GAMM|nr:MAG: Protein of unknown function DUF262 [Candidatus Kentron sp. SD]
MVTEKPVDVEKLLSSRDENTKRASTRSLDISFNELVDMYKDEELKIDPEYQRLFRWSEGARSRFIESLLIEMPVPPIYVMEDEDRRYQLIDGLQRFSSYLHLRGELDARHLDPPVKQGELLELQDCDIVGELNGLTFNDLPTSLKIILKRSYIRVEVVKKDSDKMLRYHMFKRLNSGGELLTEQEKRNCTIRMLNPDFMNFIKRMSEKENYQECITNISEKQAKSGFGEELVLRFFALKNDKGSFRHDVTDFLTEYAEKVSKGEAPFDYEKEEAIFNKTFLILKKSLGDKSFGRAGDRSIGSNFSVYHFEAICTGLQTILDPIHPEEEQHIKKLKQKLEDIKRDDEFKSVTTGGGKNSPGLLDKRIRVVSGKLSEVQL